MKKYVICMIFVSLVAIFILSGCVTTPVSSTATVLEEVITEPQMVGAYTDFREPDADEIALFNSVMNEDYEGAILYIPKLVKTQVVAGLNYFFLAIADPQQEGIEPYEVDIIIYQPLAGDPELTEIIVH